MRRFRQPKTKVLSSTKNQNTFYWSTLMFLTLVFQLFAFATNANTTSNFTEANNVFISKGTCNPHLTINNNGNCAVDIYWVHDNGHNFYTKIHPGDSWTQSTYEHHKWKAVNHNVDWNNILYKQHYTVGGCNDQTWNIEPNYCLTEPINLDPNCDDVLVSYNLDACQAFDDAYSFDEFTPTFTTNSDCGNISATNVYRHNPHDYYHSCLQGQSGNAMCISGTHVDHVPSSSVHRLKFSTTLGEGTTISGLSFFQKSEEHILNNGVSHTVWNNYLKKYSVRIKIGGNIVYQSDHNHTSQYGWNLASFDLSSVAALDLNSTTTVDFELVAYKPVNNGADMRAWEIDEIKIYGCCEAPATGLIGDFVFEDTNGNGIQDAGELGIDGVTVMLLDGNGNMLGNAQTTTNGGQYLFTDLPAGDYKVKFTAPNGFEFTAPNQGGNDLIDSDAVVMAGTADAMTEVITIGEGDEILSLDAGLFVPASLGNYVFEDINENGIQDFGEPGIDGVTVMLLDAAGNMIASVQTANGGVYEFAGLAPGDYNVKFPQAATTNSGVPADLTSPNQGNNDAADSDAVPMPGTTDAMSQIVTLESGDNDDTIDAGYVPGKATIGDVVFEDTNGNGIQDANEPGIDGVTVMLLDANGNMVGSAQTTANGGAYDFVDVAPGTYKVKFTTPNGYVLTDANQGNDDTKDSDAVAMAGTNDAMTQLVTVNAGDDENDLDAGYYLPARLGDIVFEDINGNGIQDFEPGIDGVTVMLLDAAGNMIASVQTANGGVYEFAGLAPGDYKVKFPQSATTNSGVPADLTAPNQGNDDTTDSDAVPMPGTTDAMSQIVTLESGDNDPTIDAGYIPGKATIGDIVFEDTNGNGIQDDNEPGIDGVTVMLLDANGNMVGTAQTTANGGAYDFIDVAPGTYKVKFTTPNGYVLTDANQGNDDTKDSDAVAMDATTSMTQLVTVNAGDDENDLDAGYYLPARLGDIVFEDVNGNGIQDFEPGIDGVTVMLLDAAGNMIASVQTANGGVYEFAGLAPGDYKVKFPQAATTNSGVPADLTAPNQGNNDAADSDAVPMPGTTDAMSQIVTLESGDNDPTIDAGYIPGKATIGDIVFEDKNANGIQDAGEPGIDGVTVMLLDAAGNMVAGVPAQTTANGGAYDFTNLAPGTYKVKFTAPTLNGVSAELTDANQGADDTIDSDAVAMPGTNDAMSQPITVAANDDIDDVDAGYYFPAKLGNYVWEDKNLDGIQDIGEPGIEGVPVELRDAAGNTLDNTITDVNGLYEFAGLEPGDYKVVFPTQANVAGQDIILTLPNQGTNDAADSDAIPMAVVNEAMSQVVTLESGDNDDSIDAGYFGAATLGDKAFIDEDQNGLQDNADNPLPGVTVTLTGTDVFGNSVSLTQTTDQDGEYLFTMLVPGTYEVQFTQPATYVVTRKDEFGNGFDFADSDIDPITGKTDPITLASGDDNRSIDAGFFLDPALPVALTSFEAQLVNNSEVVLKWVTASEEDNSHFVVERSIDGRDFEAIGTVEGNGTTNQINTYSLVDEDPAYGYNYYRLKQVDFDGDYEYSHVETVIISSQDVPDVILYPNPVVKTTTLRVVTPFETDANIQVVDMTGKVVLDVVMAQGANSKQLDLSGFAAGTYFAYVNYNGHRELVHKVIKVEE